MGLKQAIKKLNHFFEIAHCSEQIENVQGETFPRGIPFHFATASEANRFVTALLEHQGIGLQTNTTKAVRQESENDFFVVLSEAELEKLSEFIQSLIETNAPVTLQHRNQRNALHFYITLANQSLDAGDIRASVNVLLQFGAYIQDHYAQLKQVNLDDIHDSLAVFVNDFRHLVIPNSLLLNAVISARNHMLSPPLSDEEMCQWDPDAQSFQWKQQLSDLLYGGHCYLSLLNNRGNNHE